MKRIAPGAARRIVLQIGLLILIVVVVDYMSDSSFPHHWIFYTIVVGLLAIIAVVYLMLGPEI